MNSIKVSDSEHDLLALGSQCNRSNHCCRFGSGFVKESDLKPLAHFLKTDVQTLQDHCLESVTPFGKLQLRTKLVHSDHQPHGTCIFFNSSMGCTVHEAKPLHCRIGNCGAEGNSLSQWYFANFVIDKKDPQSVLSWKEYLKTHQAIPGATPEEWT